MVPLPYRRQKAPAGYNKDAELTDTAGFSSRTGLSCEHQERRGISQNSPEDRPFRGQTPISWRPGVQESGWDDVQAMATPIPFEEHRYRRNHTIQPQVLTESMIQARSRTVWTQIQIKMEQGSCFGNTDLVDDADGAFEYGSYTIEEISCAANKGKGHVFGSFTINGEKDQD